MNNPSAEDNLALFERQTLELEPLSLSINTAVGWTYLMAGRYDDAIRQYQFTLQMDGNFVMARRELGVAFLAAGMYQEAQQALAATARLTDGDAITVAFLGTAYALSGQQAATHKIAADLKQRAATDYVPPVVIATLYAGLNEIDRALECLEQAFTDRSSPMIWMKIDPCFGPLRGDQRFISLLQRMGLD